MEVADKYVEYDPVIVIIDLVLLRKEAYRHVLYNTQFKVYYLRRNISLDFTHQILISVSLEIMHYNTYN